MSDVPKLVLIMKIDEGIRQMTGCEENETPLFVVVSKDFEKITLDTNKAYDVKFKTSPDVTDDMMANFVRISNQLVQGMLRSKGIIPPNALINLEPPSVNSSNENSQCSELDKIKKENKELLDKVDKLKMELAEKTAELDKLKKEYSIELDKLRKEKDLMIKNIKEAYEKYKLKKTNDESNLCSEKDNKEDVIVKNEENVIIENKEENKGEVTVEDTTVEDSSSDDEYKNEDEKEEKTVIHLNELIPLSHPFTREINPDFLTTNNLDYPPQNNSSDSNESVNDNISINSTITNNSTNSTNSSNSRSLIGSLASRILNNRINTTDSLPDSSDLYYLYPNGPVLINSTEDRNVPDLTNDVNYHPSVPLHRRNIQYTSIRSPLPGRFTRRSVNSRNLRSISSNTIDSEPNNNIPNNRDTSNRELSTIELNGDIKNNSSDDELFDLNNLNDDNSISSEESDEPEPRAVNCNCDICNNKKSRFSNGRDRKKINNRLKRTKNPSRIININIY